MRADEFWSLGTVLTITLQSSQELGNGALDSLTVPAMVVRRAEGAAGFAIALTSEQSLLFPGFRVEEPRNVRDQMKCFLDRITSYGPALPLQIAADAAAPPILNRDERLLLLLESAKKHRLSQAWDSEIEDEPQGASLAIASPLL